MKGQFVCSGLVCLVVVFAVCGVYCQPAEDEVTSLPGLSKAPNFKQYSGYLDATGTRHLHYWYVESQHDPNNDPLVLWLNGGPGCSSLDGFLSELGPFRANNGETLDVNPNSWNLVANVLFLESPAGVGYSYADDKNYTTGDEQVATDNYKALQSFFAKFPNRKKNVFYIFGESYGGIYVPTLAVKVMNGNASINFQGFGVGNGFHDRALNTDTLVEFAYFHTLAGEDLWNQLHKNCCNGTNCTYYNNPNSACQLNVEKVMDIMMNSGINYYDMYRDCYGGVTPVLDRYLVDMAAFFSSSQSSMQRKLDWLRKKPNNVGFDVPCINSTAETSYLNRADVRKALHIKEGLPPWEICSANVTYNYRITDNPMYDEYKALLPRHRALVYHGDVDMACNFLLGQKFVYALGQPEKEARRTWIYKNQVAGFVHKFENITFMTVKGAGHTVPQFSGPQALQMFTNFLNKSPQ